MTLAALVEGAAQTPRVYPVPAAGGAIGRSPSAGIRLEDETVSRMHAAIRRENDAFVIENRSTKNVTRVDGVALSGPTPLADGATIELGRVRLRFHDLSAGDRLSGPRCSYCERENLATANDCWYCGTSLVNAPTSVIERRPVVCRLVARDESVHDLLPNMTLQVAGDGNVRLAPAADMASAGQVRTDGDWAQVTAAEGATVNGEPAAAGRTLRTGDLLLVGDAAFLVIARASPDR